jgi:hypothetical protein
MNLRLLTVSLLAAALPLGAQEKKPPATKPATTQTDADKLNKLKQDLRNKDAVKKAKQIIEDAVKKDDAAKKEAARIEAERRVPDIEDAQAKLERLKKSSDDSAAEELKSLLKDNQPVLEEELRKLRARVQERIKTEGGPKPAVPAPAPEPAPGSFDSELAPVPVPLQTAPDFQTAPLTADRIVSGPLRDPKNPARELPDSDPRTRTYVLTGNVRLRRPDMALDADEVTILFKQGATPSALEGQPAKEMPPGVDPVNRKKADSAPFERIVARGRVRFMLVDKTGKVQVGRGGHLIFDEKSGWFVIKEWPEAEFGPALFRGPSKESIIRLSRVHGGDASGCAIFDLERELTPEDLPKTPDKPVPAAGPVRPRSSSAPSPAPR